MRLQVVVRAPLSPCEIYSPMPFDSFHDARVRKATFDWLGLHVSQHGDVLSWKLLSGGFQIDGIRVPLLGSHGIFKPRVLQEVPLSITTVFGGPHDDSFGSEGLLRYRYRGKDPNHADNRGLRSCVEQRLPLVYLHGVAEGRYLAAWPSLVVSDSPYTCTFTVAVDDVRHAGLPTEKQSPLRAMKQSSFDGRTQPQWFAFACINAHFEREFWRHTTINVRSA